MAQLSLLAAALAEATRSADDFTTLATRYEAVGLPSKLARKLADSMGRRRPTAPAKLETWFAKRLGDREEFLTGYPPIRRWFFADAPPSAPRWNTPALDDTVAVARWLAKTTGFEDLTRERLVGIAFPWRSRACADASADPYSRRWVSKRSGGARLIEAPRSTLRAVQRALLDDLIALLPVHDAACGFRRGAGTVLHASKHVGREVVVRVDLEDFFSSIHAARVRGMIRAAGYPGSVAHLIAALCTTETPSRVVPLREGLRAGRSRSPSVIAFVSGIFRRALPPRRRSRT